MSKEEARDLVRGEIHRYRSMGYSQLLHLRKNIRSYEVTGQSGEIYAVEVQAFWDSGRSGALRVMASIDGGGIPSSRPVCEDFIVAETGEFVGE